ncbi:MAG: transcription antitermination factor NusB [Bacillota bacterium]|jgi:N utilization substance protein B
MSRKVARELAFQIIFEIDVGKHKWREVLARVLNEETELPQRSREFLTVLVTGIMEHLAEIDGVIAKYARDWTVERLANTDRNILRMAVFELKHLSEIPIGATVNEAVELAKRYGEADSGKFVNGILGEIARSAGTGQTPSPTRSLETTEEE